jgi:hypothetical protein
MGELAIELKPCPRCGSPAEISHDDGASFPIVCDFPYHAVCSDMDGCGISSFAFSTEQEAIEWWNDRKVLSGEQVMQMLCDALSKSSASKAGK